MRRRSFLGSAALAGLSLGPASRVLGANGDIRVAILGVRGKGNQHIRNFSRLPGVRVTAICDPDRHVLEQRRADHDALRLTTHDDLRRVLDARDVDAVVVATPNHWHALATIWACQAGKDVYCEKPCSHNIDEGQRMIAAARHHRRMVQVGTQRRSDAGLAEAFAEIRRGVLGPIVQTRVIHYSRRQGIGAVDGPQPVPASVDYNLWAGPAPLSPVLRRQFHYDWHWFWETGNGELGNNGPHELDLCRWAAGYGQLPRRVVSIGGRYGWDDRGQTPNTHVIYYDYQPAPLIVEIRNLPARPGARLSDQYRGIRTGVVIECEGGYFAGMNGGGFYDRNGKRIRKVPGDGGRHHPANFISAVRSRRVSDLNCDIAEGHLSTALCHLGNISHRLGHRRRGPEVRRALRDQPRLSDAFERMAVHLQAHGLVLEESPPVLGPMLALQPDTQRFVGPGADEANALCRRAYRAPFKLPPLT